MSTAKIKYRQDNDKSNDAVQAEISQLIEKNSGLIRQRQDLLNKETEFDNKASSMESRRQMLLRSAASIQQRYKDIAVEKWNGETVCPSCGQPLPEDKIAHAQEEFNQHKSERLESATADMNRINERGKSECSKNMIATAKAEMNRCHDEAAELDTDMESS